MNYKVVLGTGAVAAAILGIVLLTRGIGRDNTLQIETIKFMR